MESKHTKEPWQRDEKLSRVIFDSNGISIGSMYTDEDVHRVLCCVNAMKCIENPSTLIREHQLMKEALEKIGGGHAEAWSKDVAINALKQLSDGK